MLDIAKLMDEIRECARREGCISMIPFPKKFNIALLQAAKDLNKVYAEMKSRHKWVDDEDKEIATLSLISISIAGYAMDLIGCLGSCNEEKALEAAAKLIYNTLSACSMLDWPLENALKAVGLMLVSTSDRTTDVDMMRILDDHRNKN